MWRGQLAGFALLLISLVTACATPASRQADGGLSSQGGSPGSSGQPRRATSIIISITSGVDAFSNMGGTTTTGGWVSVSEVHSNALIASDVQTRRPIGRLAAKVPSLDDGSITLLPDGRMRVVYELRRDVTWHDGVPFTAHDMVFSTRLNKDSGIPNPHRTQARLIESAEAEGDHTFVLVFREPLYLANALGIRVFAPHPRHLLEEAYARYLAGANVEEFVNLPYWTSEYVHTGPFRLASFDPAGDIVFHAYERYFLGRPKLDTVRVRLFSDERTLFANLLAGTVDVLMESTLGVELAAQLKERWETTGDGTVHSKPLGQRFLASQWKVANQVEPANLQLPIRAALYHALDRETLSEGLQAGRRDLAAWELLSPGSLHYEETKGAYRRYGYDPERARAMLREAGWTAAEDGILRHSSDGRRFRNSISGTSGREQHQVSAVVDYWRRIGIDVEERVVPPAFVRDTAYRAQYPGWELSTSAPEDGILRRLEGPAASAENRWTGNRDGYEDPQAQQLLSAYWGSLGEQDQLRTLRAIQDFAAAELPLLLLWTTADHIAVRKGVRALDDHGGGGNGGAAYGTYSRNAHLWDAH